MTGSHPINPHGGTGGLFDRLTVVGMGLMGSSVLRAARQQGIATRLVGVGRRQETVRRALELGLVDEGTTQISDVKPLKDGTELFVVAVPVQQMESVFATLSGITTDSSLVTDVGSTKASVVEAANRAWSEATSRFVPAHPIAGSEQNGIEAGFAELFVNHWVILTPGPETDTGALSRVEQFWQRLGARTERMSVQHHDEVLAATSHLPHLLAYALVDALATLEDSGEIFRYAAGGFRDFSRIAESDPQMWHDILLANRDALLSQLENFDRHLEKLREAIHNGDGKSLMNILVRAQQARRAYRHLSEAED